MFYCRFISCFLSVIMITLASYSVLAKAPPRSRFYDFTEQLIDGQVKKPTTLYTNARQHAKFDRLLKLKISFIPRLLNTARLKVFK